MNVLIVYCSYTGFTKKYAGLLSEQINCTLIEFKKFKSKMLKNFDRVIFISPVFSDKICNLKKFVQKFEKASFIPLYVAAVGMSKEPSLRLLRENNIPLDLESIVPLFYMQGGFDKNMLKGFHKIVMNFTYKNLKAYEQNNLDVKSDFIQAYENTLDRVSPENLTPLINALLDEYPPPFLKNQLQEESLEREALAVDFNQGSIFDDNQEDEVQESEQENE